MEAISNAGSCVGILAKDGVVLAAEKRITSKAGLRCRAAARPASANPRWLLKRRFFFSRLAYALPKS